LGNYTTLKRTILSANTLRIILVFPQNLRICGNYIRKKYNVTHIWCSLLNLPHIIVKYPESCCRFPLNLLVHYLDNPHKLEYVDDDGEIIINNVSDGNE